MSKKCENKTKYLHDTHFRKNTHNWLKWVS